MLPDWQLFFCLLCVWTNVPPNFTSASLYIRSGQLQLAVSSLVEEFKVAKCRITLTVDLQDRLAWVLAFQFTQKITKEDTVQATDISKEQ